MRIYKKIQSFISLVCSAAILLSVLAVYVVAADGNRTVTATTSASVKQGSSGTCYVYIDSTESLAALDVTVHFDPSRVKVNSVYNSVSCVLYDNATNTDNIQFNYILDGKGSSSQTRLFYFSYQILSGAEIGDAYFDITIGEAYDSNLNDVAVSGSRCKFTITEMVTNKSCTVSSSSTVSTSVEKEFSLKYRFSTYQIASGSAVISYDPELFEVVEVTSESLLTDKLADINTTLAGSVYVSFVGTSYNYNYDFITVKFRTKKNVTETSKIVFKATELCDLDLNAISCSGYTTNVSVTHDDSYIGDAPKMSVSAEYNESTEKVMAVICLEKNSRLGAGDFIVNFDPSVLTLSSYEKGFTPTFFDTNETELSDGKLIFSIISLEDITTAETVITLTFDVAHIEKEKQTEISISGNLLTDSMVKPIALNFIDGQVVIPEKHTYSGDCDETCNSCDATRETSVAHSFPNGKFTCEVCGFIGVPSTITSSTHTVSGNNISKITAGTTVSQLLANLNEGEYCKIYKDGSEISGDTTVGTGMTVSIVDGETVSATYTIIVTGDTNGDGDISISDMISVKSHILEKSSLTDAYGTAADTNGDGDISITDFIQIKASILGKSEITAR